MSHTHPRLSVGHRIFQMSLTWLIIGTMVGAIGGVRSGAVIELVSGVLGGMIVLPVVGAFLGVIGGDAKGSVVGAVGGLMGCWLAKPTGGISLDAVSVEVVVIFGALVGATCLLYLQFVRWGHKILLRRACQLVGGALMLCRAPALAGYFGATNDRSRNTAHFPSRPERRRAQLTKYMNSDRD
jgi:hypothetical protein